MQLILSCVHDVNSVTNKNNLILLVDTKSGCIEWIPLDIREADYIIGSKALCMSGDYLMVSLKTKNKFDDFIVIKKDIPIKGNNKI